VLLRSFENGNAHDSITRTVEAIVLPEAVAQYSNDLGTDSDFLLDGGFSVYLAAGFSDPALHTPHDYPNQTSMTAVLTQPIVIGNTTTLSFDEVVLVEPGQTGVPWPDPDFWDYVVVEGSNDGLTWIPLLDGYDSREYADWESAYYSSTPGSSSLFHNRQIVLNDTFAKWDKIFLRFRLYADFAANGWGWAIDNIVVDTPAPTDAPRPHRLALDQNLPNPFNPRTEIRFELPRAARVTLQVYDLRGRLVRTLVNGPREAGPQTVTWSGRDARGAEVASGVYVYRLATGGQVLQRKMTLLK
jgi:hypothetical protein